MRGALCVQAAVSYTHLGLGEAVLCRVLLERRNDRARNALSAELRRDVNALDLECPLVDLLPRCLLYTSRRQCRSCARK